MSGAETVELKPCPFCRGKASVHQWDDNFGIVLEGQEPLPTSYHIACDDCDAGHPPSYNRDEAIAAWHTRATQADALAVMRDGASFARTVAKIVRSACDCTERHRTKDAVIVPTREWHRIMTLIQGADNLRAAIARMGGV